jgi:hypothetical protein
LAAVTRARYSKTAISAALDAKLVQVFIGHPQENAVKAASLR